MHKKDYLQRQFEEFGKVLAVILGLKLNKDWEKFEKEIQDAASKFTGLQIEEIENYHDDEFLNKILVNENLSLDQKKIIATLLFEKMNLYAASKNEAKYKQLKHRCLLAYRHLKDNLSAADFDLDIHYKIEALSRI